VYVAHLLSVRFTAVSGFGTSGRDAAARRLAAALRAEKSPRVLLVGDVNGTTADKGLSAVTSGLRSARDESGAGFGFSRPASFPVARIDRTWCAAWNHARPGPFRQTGSDHLPVAASVRL
jgi:vancomycin resistance protein VanJ